MCSLSLLCLSPGSGCWPQLCSGSELRLCCCSFPQASVHCAFNTFHEKSSSRKSSSLSTKGISFFPNSVFAKWELLVDMVSGQEQILQHVKCNSKVTFFWNQKLWECFPSAPLSSVPLFPAGSRAAAEVIWPYRPFAHIRFCLSLCSAFVSLATFSNCNYIKRLCLPQSPKFPWMDDLCI